MSDIDAAATDTMNVWVNPANATYEQLIGNEHFMREVIQLLVQGNNYADIAKHFGIEWPMMMRVARRVVTYVSEETIALATVWQGAEFVRLEAIKKRAHAELVDDTLPLNSQKVTAYTRLVMTELAVLTLNRGTLALPDLPIDEDETVGVTKADMIERYSQLVDKLAIGVLNAGYGDGTYDGDEDDEEMEESLRRADNSDSIEDAVVLDERGDIETDIAPTGVWENGKWVAT